MCEYELKVYFPVYEPESGTDPIRYYEKLPKTEWFLGYKGEPGWYFWTKEWKNVVGPFSTLDKCRKALSKYRNRA